MPLLQRSQGWQEQVLQQQVMLTARQALEFFALGLQVYLCVYIHICICTSIYVDMYTRIYIHIYIPTRTHIYRCIYICVCIYVYMGSEDMYVGVCVYIYIYVYIFCIYVYWIICVYIQITPASGPKYMGPTWGCLESHSSLWPTCFLGSVLLNSKTGQRCHQPKKIMWMPKWFGYIWDICCYSSIRNTW